MTDLLFKLLLLGVVFGTSIVSGVLGMAGGLILLSALLLKLDPLIAVPVHGMVQVVSNGSRAWFLRRQVSWQAVLRFAWPLLPAGALGLFLLQRMPAAAGRVLIGLFVLVATWLPKKSAPGAGRSEAAWRGLPVGGALVGFFSTLVGATGPLLGPFILALDLGPAGTIGTLAGCQILQHASKVLLFGLGGFDFGAYLLWTSGLCISALLGTAVGTRVLGNLRPATFNRVIRLVITALSLQLLASGTWDLLAPARSVQERAERLTQQLAAGHDRGTSSSAVARHAPSKVSYALSAWTPGSSRSASVGAHHSGCSSRSAPPADKGL